MITYQRFAQEYEEEIIHLWNECLYKDPVSVELFHQKILFDPNYDNDFTIVAMDDRQEKIIGYALAMYRKYPYEERGMEPERGWISVFFVHPDYERQGIATAMITRLEEKLLDKGKVQLTIAAYSPNYFFPGPDRDAYPKSISLLQKLGYQITGEAVGMDMILFNFTIPAKVQQIKEKLQEENNQIIPFKQGYELKFLAFLQEHFPGGWVANGRNALIRGEAGNTILLATDKDDEIIGFCMRSIDRIGAHFGPFGVRPDLRGKSIGTVLFYEMMADMYQKGFYHTWLAWTDGKAQKFYERAGMKVCKRHAIMKKEMER